MRVVLLLSALAGALVSSPAVAAGGSAVPVGLTPGADGYPGAVARMVTSIIEYTRWPDGSGPLTLCVVGPAAQAARLDGLRLSDGRVVQRRNVSVGEAATAGCKALYLGPMSAGAMRQLVASVRGRGVLTIAEADPDGRGEAMFSLLVRPGSLSFRLNVDAVSRSGLRVDPRVLRLSQGAGK